MVLLIFKVAVKLYQQYYFTFVVEVNNKTEEIPKSLAIDRINSIDTKSFLSRNETLFK